MDPVRELPYRPAACEKLHQQAGHTEAPRLRSQSSKNLLASEGAFSNRACLVKPELDVARPGHGSLRGRQTPPQHLVRSEAQVLQGPQRACADGAPTAPFRAVTYTLAQGDTYILLADVSKALRCRCRWRPTKRFAGSPYAMKDDGEFSSQSDASLARAGPLQSLRCDARFTRCRITTAASYISIRARPSPHREIRPLRSISPDW